MAATSLLMSTYSYSASVSSPHTNRHHKNQNLGNNPLQRRFQFHPPSRGICLIPPPSASPKPQPGNGEPPFLPQEDLKYLARLGAGSVAGAAAIKYGSILLPGITQPNLFQALSMITLPVLLAVWLLLIRQTKDRT